MKLDVIGKMKRPAPAPRNISLEELSQPDTNGGGGGSGLSAAKAKMKVTATALTAPRTSVVLVGIIIVFGFVLACGLEISSGSPRQGEKCTAGKLPYDD